MKERTMGDLERSENPEQSDNPFESRRPRSGHWKPALLAVGGVLALALLLGLATGAVQEAIDVAAGPPLAADEPPLQVIEACNSYAASAASAQPSILGDEGVGGDDAASGGGADSGPAAGTLFGLSEENRRNEAARIAYADCMERRGY